jgi:hypothetical protein
LAQFKDWLEKNFDFIPFKQCCGPGGVAKHSRIIFVTLWHRRDAAPSAPAPTLVLKIKISLKTFSSF